MRTSFCLAVSPRASATDRRGRPSFSARNSVSASLARPSTGGAVSFTFSVSPSQPQISSREAPGMTFTASRQEFTAAADFQASASASAEMISSTGSVPMERRSRLGSMPLAASSARPASLVTRS